MKKLLGPYLYITLLILSMLVLSAAGLYWLQESGDDYTKHPALAALAIYRIEQVFAGPLPELPKEPDPLPPEDITGMAQTEGTQDALDGGTSDAVSVDEAKEASVDEAKAASGDEAKAASGDEADISSTDAGYETGAGEADTEFDTGYDEETTEEALEEQEFDEKMAQLDEAIRRKKERARRQKELEEERRKQREKERERREREAEERKKEEEAAPHYQFITVGDEYFDDAVFIGDSRQQDFVKYSGLDNAAVYADRGYQIYDTATKAVDSSLGKITVYDALAINQHRFKKVYIMFGTNEMNSEAAQDDITKYYYRLIHEIKRMEPDAIIYLEGIYHVTKEISDSHLNFTNEWIDEKNAILRKVAKDENIVFLDLNEVPEFTDADGALTPGATEDGVHLNRGGIGILKDYLRTHALEFTGGEDKYPYVELTTRQEELLEAMEEGT